VTIQVKILLDQSQKGLFKSKLTNIVLDQYQMNSFDPIFYSKKSQKSDYSSQNPVGSSQKRLFFFFFFFLFQTKKIGKNQHKYLKICLLVVQLLYG
jgi:hypothetical protein